MTAGSTEDSGVIASGNMPKPAKKPAKPDDAKPAKKPDDAKIVRLSPEHLAKLAEVLKAWDEKERAGGHSGGGFSDWVRSKIVRDYAALGK
jgi:hypothetical protein